MEKETALKILRELHSKTLFSKRTALETLIPELAEPEDERIRKELIGFLKSPFVNKNLTDKKVALWISWLEKQEIDENKGNFRGISSNSTWSEEDEKFLNYAISVTDDAQIKKFLKSLKDRVILQTTQGKQILYNPAKTFKNFRSLNPFWTIQDAKDGDVLASGGVVFIFKIIHGVWLNCHCSAHKDGSFIADSYNLMTDKYFGEVQPATKEQRDLLFQKMKEAGYEWDSVNKELKRIE